MEYETNIKPFRQLIAALIGLPFAFADYKDEAGIKSVNRKFTKNLKAEFNIKKLPQFSLCNFPLNKLGIIATIH